MQHARQLHAARPTAAVLHAPQGACADAPSVPLELAAADSKVALCFRPQANAPTDKRAAVEEDAEDGSGFGFGEEDTDLGNVVMVFG